MPKGYKWEKDGCGMKLIEEIWYECFYYKFYFRKANIGVARKEKIEAKGERKIKMKARNGSWREASYIEKIRNSGWLDWKAKWRKNKKLTFIRQSDMTL